MKLFKKLAGLCLALTFCAGLCAVASCGGKDKDTDKDSTPVTSEQPGEATCYTVTVLNADGTPATDVRVQFCIVEANGSLGGCLMSVPVDANGVCEYLPMGFPGARVYEIHVLNADESAAFELTDVVRTEATFGAYTVTLAE